MIKIKIAGIYKIEHISGYYYIGKSTDIFSRWGSHHTLLYLNKHHSPKFQTLWNKSKPSEWTFNILEKVSKSDVKNITNLKGKELDKLFNKVLTQYEKSWMKEYSINFSLNKLNKSFS